MSLHGMPPLPKSLSGFAEGDQEVCESPTNPEEPPPADLDSQLTYLKKEMVSGTMYLNLSALKSFER